MLQLKLIIWAEKMERERERERERDRWSADEKNNNLYTMWLKLGMPCTSKIELKMKRYPVCGWDRDRAGRLVCLPTGA